MEHTPSQHNAILDALSNIDAELLEALDHALNFEGYGVDTLTRAYQYLHEPQKEALLNAIRTFASSTTELDRRNALETIVDLLS